MARFGDYEKVGKEFGIGGQDRFDFKPGENKVRLVSEFQEYATHFIKGTGGVACEGEYCEYCFKGKVKRRVQFVGWLLDRADGMFKLAYIGWSVFKQIGEYATSSEFGFDGVVPPYDIIVKKTGEGLGTEYTVMPSRNEAALTIEEQEKLATLRDPKEIVRKTLEKYPGSRLEKPFKGVAKPHTDDIEIPVINEEDGTPRPGDDDLPF